MLCCPNKIERFYEIEYAVMERTNAYVLGVKYSIGHLWNGMIMPQNLGLVGWHLINFFYAENWQLTVICAQGCQTSAYADELRSEPKPGYLSMTSNNSIYLKLRATIWLPYGMCIHACTHLFGCIYMYVCACMHTHAHTNMYICACLHAYAHTGIHRFKGCTCLL